jgi:hypothetical protein
MAPAVQTTYATEGSGTSRGSGEPRASGGSIEGGAHDRPLLEAASPGSRSGGEVSRQEPGPSREPPVLPMEAGVDVLRLMPRARPP